VEPTLFELQSIVDHITGRNLKWLQKLVADFINVFSLDSLLLYSFEVNVIPSSKAYRLHFYSLEEFWRLAPSVTQP